MRQRFPRARLVSGSLLSGKMLLSPPTIRRHTLSSLFKLKRGDTAPPFQATITDDGPVDFTTATAIKVIGLRDRTPVFARAATGNAEGVVTMPWQQGDTAIAGLVRVEIEATWPDGSITTYPPDGYLHVLVSPDLGGTVIPDPPSVFGASDSTLKAWVLTEAYTATAVTRDVNEAIVTAVILWPDGASGVLTTDTASAAFLGSVDAYHVTYVPPAGTGRTVTQPLITRDPAGAVIAQPPLVVT